MSMPGRTEQPEYDLEDYLAFDGTERIELLNGELLMQAAPSRAHQAVSMALSAQLYSYLKGKNCKVYAAPFAVRPFQKPADRLKDVKTVLEPDLTVVCDPDKLDDLGCKGAPDLVIEILSPASQRHDRVVKFNLYQRAGVREYWIVDPAGKTAQSFVLEGGGYLAKEFGTPGDSMKVHILEGCSIDLAAVFSE